MLKLKLNWGIFDMRSDIKEIITLALISLVVVVIIILLILLIFLFSGHEGLLEQMLQSTAKGEIPGTSFTVYGPFSMWIIAYFVLWIKSAPVESIKLYLNFPDSRVPPPESNDQFRNADCWYTIFSDGNQVKPEKKAIIQKDVSGPYIYANPQRIKNPEFQVRLKYIEHEWISDSYSPLKGRVYLR